MNLTRTFDLIPFQLSHSPNAKALNVKIEGGWKSYSTQEILGLLQTYSHFLRKQGLKKGDFILLLPKAATLSFIVLDLAAQKLGITVVLVHSTTKAAQFENIVFQTKAQAIFVEDESLVERYQQVWGNTPYFQLGGKNNLAFSKALSEVTPSNNSEEVPSSILEEELSTIIYTSGTKGVPKGVMLTHKNIMANVTALAPLLPLKPSDRVISFLPYSHVFERTTVFTYLCLGLEIYLIEEPKELARHLKEVRPHMFTAVPRILEQMYEIALVAKTEKKFLGKYLLNWAFRHGSNYKERKGLNPSRWVKMFLFRVLIFRKFRRAIGGKLKGIIVGAAHMNPAISRTFALGGIPVREGYGMTETSPVVTVNRMKPGLNAYGTVGLPLPGVKVKIDQPDENGVGEILVKGPNVMKGYFNEPEATQAVFSPEGWLHTGDMGYFVKKRFLQITDRKKDLFKTSAGKYIAPQIVEAHFRESRFIDQLLVIGFKRPFLSALILPNFTVLSEWAEESGVHWTSPTYMVLNIKVKDRIQQEIDELNKDLPGHERIKEFHLLHEAWTQESGLLSHTLKPIRPQLLSKYEKEIDQMYG